jgi:hypothetical protein
MSKSEPRSSRRAAPDISGNLKLWYCTIWRLDCHAVDSCMEEATSRVSAHLANALLMYVHVSYSLWNTTRSRKIFFVLPVQSRPLQNVALYSWVVKAHVHTYKFSDSCYSFSVQPSKAICLLTRASNFSL